MAKLYVKQRMAFSCDSLSVDCNNSAFGGIHPWNLIDFAFAIIKWAFYLALAVVVVWGVVAGFFWIAHNQTYLWPVLALISFAGGYVWVKAEKAEERERVRQWELAAVKAADEALKKKPFDPYQALREIREEREAAKLAAQGQPSDLG